MLLMSKETKKNDIKITAVKLFSEKGFYGTSIRDIAKAANCSLPMLYYYYNNKNDLFEEIVYKEFISLIERLNNAIPKNDPLEEIYFLALKQRKELNEYETAVYKLALKVWLGFEGSPEIREKLLAWESGRYERNKMILSKICTDEAILSTVTEIMVGLFENITTKIILQNKDIPDEEIKNVITFVMNSLKSF